MFLAAKHVVEVYWPGEPVAGRFGEIDHAPGQWVTTPVVGWAIARTEEKDGESVLRTVDVLDLYCTPESAPPPGGKIRLPNQTVWEVEGNPEDYRHGPFWNPGLLVIHAKRTEG